MSSDDIALMRFEMPHVAAKASAADRKWFKKHKDRSHRLRAALKGELAGDAPQSATHAALWSCAK